jgi:hypothetical protein
MGQKPNLRRARGSKNSATIPFAEPTNTYSFNGVEVAANATLALSFHAGPTLAVNANVFCGAELWRRDATGQADHARARGAILYPILSLNAALAQHAGPGFARPCNSRNPVYVHRSSIGVATLSKYTDAAGVAERREGAISCDADDPRSMELSVRVERILHTTLADDPGPRAWRTSKGLACPIATYAMHSNPTAAVECSTAPSDNTGPLVRPAKACHACTTWGIVCNRTVEANTDDRVQRLLWLSNASTLWTDPENNISVEVNVTFRWSLRNDIRRCLATSNPSCQNGIFACHGFSPAFYLALSVMLARCSDARSWFRFLWNERAALA